MLTAASIIVSSQFPLELEPLMRVGMYTLRSMVSNRPSFGQFPYTCLMISAAFGQDAPAQPVWRGALELVCSWSVADHASISWIAFCAYRSSRVMYQARASV